MKDLSFTDMLKIQHFFFSRMGFRHSAAAISELLDDSVSPSTNGDSNCDSALPADSFKPIFIDGQSTNLIYV